MLNKKYLLFDIDGTLLNTGGAGKIAMLKAFEKFLGDSNLTKNYSFAGKTDRQIIKDIVRRTRAVENDIDKIVESIEQAYVNNLKSTLNEASHFRVYPNVREVLGTCKEKNEFELALLTGNLEMGAKLKLQYADLWKYFEWGVFGDISEDRIHLAEEAYEIIIQKDRDVNRKDIIILGDTVNDVRCGKYINATTIAFASGFDPVEKLREQKPDFLIYNFRELFTLLNLK